MKVRNMCLLMLTALIWGVAFVAQSVGMDYIGPFTFNSVRNIIGAVVLISCIKFLEQMSAKDNGTEKKRNVQWTDQTLLIGGISCGVALCLASNAQQIAIQYTTIGKAGFITALYIVIVPILGLFVKKKCGIKIWCAVVLAVIGFYLLCISGGFHLEKADLYLLATSFLFSVHILVIDYFSPKTDCVKMSCIQFLVCGALSAIPMFLLEHPQMASILAGWKPVLYAGVLSSGIAYTLQIVGQKGVNPAVASLILSLESVFSVLAGWLFLHQVLTTRELAGCGLIFCAIILAQLPDKMKITKRS